MIMCLIFCFSASFFVSLLNCLYLITHKFGRIPFTINDPSFRMNSLFRLFNGMYMFIAAYYDGRRVIWLPFLFAVLFIVPYYFDLSHYILHPVFLYCQPTNSPADLSMDRPAGLFLTLYLIFGIHIHRITSAESGSEYPILFVSASS